MERNRITFKLTKTQSAKVKDLAMKASGECYFVLAQLIVTGDISSLSNDAVIVNATLFEDAGARSTYEVVANLVKEEEEISQEGDVLKATDERDFIEFERILAAKCKEIANNGDVKTGFCHTLDRFACPMCGPDGCIDKDEIRSMAAKAWLYDHGFLKDDL